MALAVAMVACSGAAGTPGPAGPAGEPGEQGPPGTTDPTDPTDPVDPPEPGPVQIVKGIDDLVFHNADNGDMDTMPQIVMVADHFFPAGLMYSLDDLTEDQMKRIDVGDGIDEETGMLTVMLKDKAGYANDKITVHATDGTSKESISFHARRNRAPRVPATANRAPALTDFIVVGTQKDVVLMAKDVHAMDTPGANDIKVAIAKPAAPDTLQAHFEDDPGNKLSFDPELLSNNLMVTGGEMKVTLRGKKSTGTGAPGSLTENDIQLHLLASDGHFMSADSVHVANIRVDSHPMISKGSVLSDIVLELGATSVTATIAVNALQGLFEDDRTEDTDLRFYASLDGSEVSLNTADDGLVDATDGLIVTARSRGTATVKVYAKEAATTDSTPSLEQSSDSLSFGLIVE